jgi:cytochrome c-type biogenesis protein CcmH/NrfG
VDELRRAVRADPLTPDIHLELGFASVHTGDFASARSSWEHYLRLAPAGAEVGRVRAAIESLTKLMHVLEAHAEAAVHG